MPTERIGDVPPLCYDPDHLPRVTWGWSKGEYKHTCPKCKRVLYFVVN